MVHNRRQRKRNQNERSTYSLSTYVPMGPLLTMIGWRHVDVAMKATALDHLKDDESCGNSGRLQDLVRLE
jgi:hypothetical protein